MFEVRVHGRGGQGAVVAAELLSVAAFDGGKWAQASRTFGAERADAPVAAFCRIDDRASRLREPVLEPDAVLVLDPTLLDLPEVVAGLRPDGLLLVDSSRAPQELGLEELERSRPGVRIVTVPASDISRRHLGRPLPNGPVLGAFAALTRCVSLFGVTEALRDRFPGAVGLANAAAAVEAYDLLHERRAGSGA